MSQSPTFDPSGKGHWILEQLARGPILRRDLIELANDASVKKVTYVIAALQTQGLIQHRQRGYEMTAVGTDALETLRAGEAYCCGTSVRRAA